jgi:multicomponent K+:H+ antiporter subunit D
VSHWPIAPILIPLLAALLAMVLPAARAQRTVAVASTVLLAAVAAVLLGRAEGGPESYALGNWPAPFGIVLVVDRFAALMLAVTALCAIACLWQAARGWDEQDRDFHALFQFQLAGINGAFLTGDLFNLFVFFELLLIASYCLLQHGGGGERRVAGIHYVVLNLVGSVLFLVAVALIYGALGTLNLADLAQRLAQAAQTQVPALRAASLLLLVVFALKAAVLPLFFWLPAAYGAAAAPVAALFVVLSKVGVYAILRVHGAVFGADDSLAQTLFAWLLPAALATVVVGGLGALVANTLRMLAAYLAIASSGLLLTAVAIGGAGAYQAAQFYLPGSVFAVAALFLLADSIAARRGDRGDRIGRAAPMHGHGLAAALFFVLAISAAGLPPLAGFIGKALLLKAALDAPAAGWIIGVVLGGSLLGLVALVRAGVHVFWRVSDAAPIAPAQPWRASLRPATLLAGASVALALAAGPLADYAGRSAQRLADGAGYAAELLVQGRGAASR